MAQIQKVAVIQKLRVFPSGPSDLARGTLTVVI
jgi:hypothetical protein